MRPPGNGTRRPGTTGPKNRTPSRRGSLAAVASASAAAAARWLDGPTSVLLLVGAWRPFQALVIARLSAQAQEGGRSLAVTTGRRVLEGDGRGADVLVAVGCSRLSADDITALVVHAAIRANSGRGTVFSLPTGADSEWVPALRRAFGEHAISVVPAHGEVTR